MNMALLYVLNVILVALEVVMSVFLASGFFKRKISGLLYWASIAAIIITTVFCCILLDQRTLIKQISITILYAIWMYLVFRVGVFKSLFISAFVLSYYYAIDNFFISFYLIVIDKSASFMNDPYLYYLIGFVSRAIELLGIVLLRAWVVKHIHRHYSSPSEWLQIVAYPLSALIVMVFLTAILREAPQSSKQILVCVSVLLISDYLSVFLLDHIERQQQEIKDNAILKQSLKNAAEQIRTLEESYGQQRRLTHDFKNKLAVLKNLAGSGAPTNEVASYLDRVINTEIPANNYVHTNRRVIDLLLNQKIAEATQNHINVKFELEDLSGFPLPDDASVIVLGNLLDNAIEACDRIEDVASRYILLIMRVSKDSAYLYIENSTDKPVRITNNTIMTTKRSRFEHGYGLKNISSTLEYYDAIYTLNYNESQNCFCFSTQIPLN